ncbi:hypothetical protein CFC21_046747 [Triticum aestivum]|uniref:F-box domain-containing protein n=2 Tax=Triticum aestivum TaxID=4565 RepID=A0A3B6GQM7_WHEAT|nr:F-box/LRR-repeat protein 13-like [Triticum aestivum]KAF7035978.1 hypothetical protein CFC21_046747 [Triticum aestivum]
MDTGVPALPLNPVIAAMFRHLGLDPAEVEGFLSYTHYALPEPPVTADARLFALLPGDSVDRLSRLPDALLGNIVSRIPVKDAARTAALSRRWRGVWRSAPLVLVDSHVHPAGTAYAQRVTCAVSRVLAAHPGPFRCVHLTESPLLAGWLQTVAGKGIQELVLVNRPWPLEIFLPSTFLGMETLTRLYLGLWVFPVTADLPRATCFPNLLELGLCNVIMKSISDLDFILDRSPVLETLCLEGEMFEHCIRLVSQSLRRVQIIGCWVEEIFVVDAPCLERLIQSGGWSPEDHDGNRTKVKIGHAPKLHMLGYLELDPGHVLEVGNTIIKAGARVSPSTMVPSVGILALEVRFGVRNHAKMVPNVLRCFPNVETLHIKSAKTDRSTGKLNLKFWHECGVIECIRSRIKLLVFHDFRGGRAEIAFLKYFFETALVLKKVVILFAVGFSSTTEEAQSKLSSLGSVKRASETSTVLVTVPSDPEVGSIRSFKIGSGFSADDPFANGFAKSHLDEI